MFSTCACSPLRVAGPCCRATPPLTVTPVCADPQVAAYGGCLTRNIRDVRKDMCATEFQALTKCFHAAVRGCACALPLSPH